MSTPTSSIARRLVTYTVACSTLVAFAATGLQLYLDYAGQISDIDGRISEIERSKMGELTHALWVRDDLLLRLQLEGLVDSPGIDRAEVYEGDQLAAAVGTAAESPERVVEMAITHDHHGKAVHLGILRLQVSYTEVYDRLLRRAVVILASNAAKTAVVALLMLWIFRRLVTRHLDRLAVYLDARRGSSRADRLELDRPPDETDEIGRAVAAVNAMVARLSDHVEHVESQRGEIERLNGRLLGRVRELEAFSHSLAHNVMGPLRSVHSFAEIIQDDLDNPDALDMLGRVQRASARMEATIAGMLLLARISRDTLSLETVDITALAKELVAVVRASEPDRALECVVEEGLTVRGDRALLALALENLIRNAATFSSEGGSAPIEIGHGEVAGRPGFYVRDHGIGFEQRYASRIFSPFERLDADNPGHGLGLAVVRAVVVRHGGEVWVEATPGEGATFAFTIGHPDAGPLPLAPTA